MNAPAGDALEASRQLVLAGAAAQAAAGDLKGASELLAPSLRLSPDWGAGLDLQARIQAQQGDYEPAIALWRRVLDVEPGAPSAVAGIQEATRLSLRPWMRHLRPTAMVASVVAGLLIGVVALEAARARGTMRNVPGVATATDSLAVEQVRACPPALGTTSIPGFRTVPASDGAVALVPEEQLFTRGVQLSESARGRVRELAAWLSGNPAVVVTVTGLADTIPVPVWRGYDNGGLAARRAVAVSDLLRASGLPTAQRLVLAIGGESQARGWGLDPATRASRSAVIQLATSPIGHEAPCH